MGTDHFAFRQLDCDIGSFSYGRRNNESMMGICLQRNINSWRSGKLGIGIYIWKCLQEKEEIRAVVRRGLEGLSEPCFIDTA